MRRLASSLARHLRRIRGDERGVVAVETLIIAPLLMLGLLFSYEAYSMFRQQSLREKATYTVADILSRETAVVTDLYLDNIKRVFDLMSGTDDAQLRISAVRYRKDSHDDIDEFDLRWSKVRGEGAMTALTDGEVRKAHGVFPVMDDGEEIILVESSGRFTPPVSTGYFTGHPLETQMFVIPRFAPQLCFTDTCVPGTG
ncbi:TadE/TadG family type IV pilus assembly protein [Roseovarius ramblicola]|uniref:TadE/TadG family type IV pilus assembly protein n=1 Tax=Roseovarius ramblicola TaxID=2022336 RepID=A0ABV5HYY9_9RHOB